jgi:hypothetical protein
MSRRLWVWFVVGSVGCIEWTDERLIEHLAARECAFAARCNAADSSWNTTTRAECREERTAELLAEWEQALAEMGCALGSDLTPLECKAAIDEHWGGNCDDPLEPAPWMVCGDYFLPACG